jgi:uncharacterized protein YaiE (UPF0345 family)
MKRFAIALVFLASALLAQNPHAPAPADSFKSLAFLEGTWEAKTNATTGVASAGTYTFAPELDGHILARHGRPASCKGPADFDCEHGDLLYIYVEAPGQPLKAIYFDNEGHVLHYDVTTPDPTTVVFLSDASRPGPQFRLTYERKGVIMYGKFQMHMPGQSDWKSYLEWSGAKQ